MTAHARQMDMIGGDLRECGTTIGGRALDSAFAQAALLCPSEVFSAETAIADAAAGRAGAVPRGVQISARSKQLGLVIESYRRVDALAKDGLERLTNLGLTALGTGLPLLAVGAAGWVMTNPAAALLLAFGVKQVGSKGIQDYLFNHPEHLDTLTRCAPWLLQGSAMGPGGMWASITRYLTGGRWPTDDYETLVGGLVNAGQNGGIFEDTGGFKVSPSDHVKGQMDPPRSVEGLIEMDGFVQGQCDKVEGDEAAIAITKLEGTPPKYIVTIPGTQAWGPVRTNNPVDLSSNVGLMAGNQVELQRQVAAAMKEAGIEPGDPVMLNGHSQGGICAAALASDPKFRQAYNVQSVVTAGSPIARFEIPPNIDVLALEHDSDAVPKLEGRENPDRKNWITVKSDVRGRMYYGEENKLMESHLSDGYQGTGRMVDQRLMGPNPDPSIEEWRQHNDKFLSGKGEQKVYKVTKS
ncbi:hypothetical protein [Austwickia sp. TVS 96-490-7B]|uniref:hypothetical protein n=1 Tax=Austwickia sp. TVS 96-490-7B TaxID=2830843 RepID=UPI001C585099|nr:hypothetical protein [Austwickia sp. TVS 96-490-7B]